MWERPALTRRPFDGARTRARLRLLWAAVALLSLAATGCVSTPPLIPSTPAPVPVPIAAPVREPTCPSCAEQTREIERLRRDLANRDAELRELRSNQREQVKVLQESRREVTRAKVKLRRLATQADAASYIAEVEVAMASLRSSIGAKSTPPQLAAAQGLLDSTAAPFAQGDYGVAMDRAAQAEQLIASVADDYARLRSARRTTSQGRLQAGIPLKATADSRLRRQPIGKARDVGVLKKDSPVIARARKGGWMHVETEDGRSGWVDQTRLAAR